MPDPVRVYYLIGALPAFPSPVSDWAAATAAEAPAPANTDPDPAEPTPPQLLTA